MKEHLVYMAMALSLVVAISVPTEGSLWWSMARGVFVVIFVMLIPTYVILRNEK